MEGGHIRCDPLRDARNGDPFSTVLTDGEPWFAAKDVCDVLGLADTNRALAGLDDDEKGTHIMSTLGGKQRLDSNIINPEVGGRGSMKMRGWSMNFMDQVSGAKVRTVLIDGEPWFVAKDVCEALGYYWNGKKTVAHVPEEWRGVGSVPTPTGNQELIIFSEQGLYFFLGRSDKPAALPMQKWVAGEVLPTIRKTGGVYLSPAKG